MLDVTATRVLDARQHRHADAIDVLERRHVRRNADAAAEQHDDRIQLVTQRKVTVGTVDAHEQLLLRDAGRRDATQHVAGKVAQRLDMHFVELVVRTRRQCERMPFPFSRNEKGKRKKTNTIPERDLRKVEKDIVADRIVGETMLLKHDLTDVARLGNVGHASTLWDGTRVIRKAEAEAEEATHRPEAPEEAQHAIEHVEAERDKRKARHHFLRMHGRRNVISTFEKEKTI